MTSGYVISEGYIEITDEGPQVTGAEGEAIDIRGANELLIALDDDADPMNSFYGDVPSFTATFDAEKFTMLAGETHIETPNVFKYWFPICDTGESAMIRYKALNSREGV
jgi:hypothetical protein